MDSLHSSNASSSSDVLPQVEHHAVIYRIVGSILVALICVVGLTGNASVVAVVYRKSSMRTPTNWYLASLALADVLLLLSAGLPTLVEYQLIVDEWVFGTAGCSVIVFAQYLGVNVSSLTMTAFTVERYLAICHPLTVQTTNSASRARRVIVGLWTAGVAYCFPWLILATTVTRRLTLKPADDVNMTSNVATVTIDSCTFSLPRRHYVVYYVADFILFYVTPLLVACVLYALIGKTLLRRQVEGGTRRSTVTRRTGSDVVEVEPRRAGILTSYGTAGAASVSQSPLSRQSRHAIVVHRESVPRPTGFSIVVSTREYQSCHCGGDSKVVKMLAVVVATFASLWLPYRAYVVYNSFASRRFEDRWFLMCCRLAVYANSAINPVLYSAMSVRFRTAFKDLLCPKSCVQRDRTGGDTVMTSATQRDD